MKCEHSFELFGWNSDISESGTALTFVFCSKCKVHKTFYYPKRPFYYFRKLTFKINKFIRKKKLRERNIIWKIFWHKPESIEDSKMAKAKEDLK